MRLAARLKASPALVVASLALLVSLTGTSVAAVQQLIPRHSVGTPQLKNNAVTSAKVRNGTLLRGDFKSGQLPRGPKGPRGATGSAGPRGPSDLHQALVFVQAAAWSSTYATQRSLSLPGGSWLVTATLAVESNNPALQSVQCRLLVGGTTVDTVDVILAPDNESAERMAMTLQGGHTLGATGPAELQCRGGGMGHVLDPSITALQVATITNA